MTKDNNLLGRFNLDGIPPAPRGVPQIQVAFSIDANGIMNVTATDKGTSKNAHITITNNKGRLSKEQVERLIKEAERYKDQDDKMRKKVEARNGLEAYCVNIKHTLNDDKLDGKFAPGEKESMLNKVNEVESWMSSNSSAETEEFEAKQKQLEQAFNPIASKLYQGTGAGAGERCGNPYQGQQSGSAGNSGPQVDEVD